MKSLSDALIEKGLIDRPQLQEARVKQIGAKTPVQDLLVEMGFLREEDLLKTAAELSGLPAADLEREQVDIAWLKKIPYELAKKHGMFPLREESGELVLAMSDPFDVLAEDSAAKKAQLPIHPVLATKSQIAAWTERYYLSHETLYDLLKNIVDETMIDFIKDKEAPGGHIEIAEEAYVPVVKLVNLMLADAVKARASDVHIEPQEDHFRIRYRIDGDLKDIMKLPLSLEPCLVNRIKVLANLDVAEKRKPQDGRMRMKVDDKEINIRVSIIPTYYGEKVVMRLLNTSEAIVKLEKLGMDERELRLVKEAVTSPQGIVLVTGPTGSGKTTTLYSVLDFIKSEVSNIITIEDPVEYLTDGISQIQVNPAKNLTFASGLRSILRQDPNVILVGEIRDQETADMAFKSSLTGHLIFSTLHTNNSLASITRLLDIGLEPYLIGSSLNLIISQRLVKVICPDCRHAYVPEPELREKFAALLGQYGVKEFFRGRGCRNCNFTGYFGRQAIFEIVKLDEEMKSLITKKATEEELVAAARAKGMRPLAESGIRKVSGGLTTLEEINRVVEINQPDTINPPAPSARPETAPAAAEPADRAVPETATILIADDEDDIAKVLKMRLRSAGFEVLRAVNGEEAVELTVKEKPDLILMDVMMPRMDGYQATRILRSRLETAHIPLIMLTAKSDIESELKGIDAGADDYISKPFDHVRLIARIKMLLRRKFRYLVTEEKTNNEKNIF